MNRQDEYEQQREEARQRIERQKSEKEIVSREQKDRRDQNKLKAQKSFEKRKQKTFWETYKDYFAYGALGAVVLFILVSNFSGDRRRLSEIPVNEEEFIIGHNDANPPFKLGTNEFFEGMNLANIKEMSNNRFSTKKTISKCNGKLLDDVIIPESYNFYKENPACRTDEVVSNKCSSSYAEVPISIFRSRTCKAGGDTTFVPSLGYLFACDNKFNTGCKGGYLANSLEFGMKYGLISEGCWSEIKGNDNECPSAEKIKTCTKEYIENFCVYETVDEIKKELYKNGPTGSFIFPYRDFLIYKNGNYEQRDKQKVDGMIFVKVVGWETSDDGSQYWLIDPLWGRTWGDDGVGKVLIGTDESLLDQVGISITPTALESSETEADEA